MSAAVAGASADGRPQPERIIAAEKDNDIKDYAETTMNELLGWYGYDKLDTRGINLKSLARPYPATSSSSSSPARHEEDVSEEETGQSVSPVAENESSSTHAGGGSPIVCAWCLKLGLKLFTLKTSSGETKEFCSEPCFNQCRRAAFKKNRVCNWCRHVRHTVNYVDFQDGDDQLQFCSDKCLNQYKMQIFCKETQAYLQMNPHLREETANNPANAKLITPDLWLRDCRESANGGASHSGDEMHDRDELEDLSVASKSEHGFLQDRDVAKVVPSKDAIGERCNTLASYLSDEKEKMDRRKRHHESNKEGSRKRQRMPPFRNKASHLAEAPPAHLSSTLSFSNPGSLFSPPSAAFPLRSKSPVLVHPPAAHSKTFAPHPGLTNSVLHPGLPPPPPLLNNDYYHSSFNPQMFSSPPQPLDAVLRMQAGLAPHFFHDSLLPFPRGPAPPGSAALPQPSTVMLPFPIFVPLPVPIPVPLPLRCFLPKDKSADSSSAPDGEGPEPADKHLVKNSRSGSDDEASGPFGGKNQVSSTDNDYDENKLLKKSKKR